MKNIHILLLFFVLTVLRAFSADRLPDREQVLATMEQVADWQLAHPNTNENPLSWTSATLWAGLFELAEVSKDRKYYDALRKVGGENQWGLHEWAKWNADNHCVGQMYLEMYRTDRDPKIKAAIQQRFDWILENPATGGLAGDVKGNNKRWNWCDALFMAPPVWARLSSVTGDKKYLEFMDREFRAVADYLYDTKEHLFFRDSRFFDRRSANGQKIFWSRGNGWVFGGLTLVLDEMPKDWPTRPFYENLFREMAARLKTLQCDDGYWRSSLLDPSVAPEPEASGTAFFTYGFAWGINQGLLDRDEYLPAVSKGWKALVAAVHPDGKLGWVQQIGHDPRSTTFDETQVYGVGAFLFAGSEIHRLLGQAEATVDCGADESIGDRDRR